MRATREIFLTVGVPFTRVGTGTAVDLRGFTEADIANIQAEAWVSGDKSGQQAKEDWVAEIKREAWEAGMKAGREADAKDARDAMKDALSIIEKWLKTYSPRQQ